MKSQKHFFYGYIIVAINFLIFMVILGLVSSFGLFIKPLTDEMGWTRAAVSVAFSLNVMAGGISGILIGMLNDKFGPRIVLPLCGLSSVIGYFFISQMHSIWQFYFLFGLIVGIGSNVYVPALSTVARWFMQKQSLMSGLAFAGAGFGMLVFPPIINRLLVLYNWRITLIILCIIITIVSILSFFFLKGDPSETGQKAYGADTITSEYHNNGQTSYSFKEAVFTRQFWLFFTALICYGFCFFSVQVHIAPFAIDMGISSAGAAAIMSVTGGATIAGQLGLGMAGDKLGYKNTFLIGLGCIVLSIIIIIISKELWAFIFLAALIGLAFGNCSTQESPIAGWLFGLKSHGAILGFFAFGFTIGAAIGPTLFGYIFDNTGSYQYAFYIEGIISILALLLTFLVRKTSRGE